MKEREFFNNLQGKWLITRNITNKLQPLLSAAVKGEAIVLQKVENRLVYSESLKVTWKNGNSSKAHKNMNML